MARPNMNILSLAALTLAVAALAAGLLLTSRPVLAAQATSDMPAAVDNPARPGDTPPQSTLENPGQAGVGQYPDRRGFCHRLWHRDTFWRWYPYGDLYQVDPAARPYWNCQNSDK